MTSKTTSWYKDAIIYQLHVKCFCDSNNDGIGDFKGLSKKLDYLQNLGCTAIWLLPFYPSPLRDDGYDIADYLTVHPNYGNLKDFRSFLNEAHSRGLKIITELVINHTSDQHQWFQRARREKPGSKWRDYYVWSDTPDKFSEARIIFKDFEASNWTWDPVAEAYYMHRFYSHQPDLNYENPDVHKEIFNVLDFWLGMGVDGMRLDAIPYLYKKEGTDCENLPETHQFLKKLRAHVDKNYTDRMLLAEANQWPEQSAAYFGNDDECHMAFNFPVMPRLFMALQMEDRFPIIDIMEQTPKPPPSCQWGTFLRNHDELTLEMVTEEERDYMYRSYANDPKARINLGIRRRLAPLMNNAPSKIHLMNVLLFSLPGSPIIYYGDEIGMGDNYYLGDRDGVRTPMQWNTDRNGGFSNANPQKLYLPLIIDPEYHHAFVNVENQERSQSSLLWWMRKMISVRKQYKAFSQGEIHFLSPANSKVLAFVREYEDENILVLVNLSKYPVYVNLNLSNYSGGKLKDIFSNQEFCTIKEGPVGLTVGGYGYYWLNIVPSDLESPQGDHPGELVLKKSWQDILLPEFEQVFCRRFLSKYLPMCRWFQRKADKIINISIADKILFDPVVFLHLKVDYASHESEYYQLPISFKPGFGHEDYQNAVITKVRFDDTEGVLIDGIFDEDFRSHLLNHLILAKKQLKGRKGSISVQTTAALNKLGKMEGNQYSRVNSGEQTNNSISFGDVMIMKFYRKIESGLNPDFEIARHLAQNVKFKHTPHLLGSIQYTEKGSSPSVLAMIQEFVPNGGDMWQHTLDAIRLFFENTLIHESGEEIKMGKKEAHESLKETIGSHFLQTIKLLGTRTAELHLALSKDCGKEEFKPEPFTWMYQKSLFQSIRSQIKKSLNLLKQHYKELNEADRPFAEHLLDKQRELENKISGLQNKKLTARKMRIHGDYHLGQVLYTGNDLSIIDFEGEPVMPLSERKLKKSPLQDVAGMIRSFHYASLWGFQLFKQFRGESALAVKPYCTQWYKILKDHFISSYSETLSQSKPELVPEDIEDFNTLLSAHLIQKAAYELYYEMQNRPDKVMIPIMGLSELLEDKSK